ncbi:MULTISPECIES: hypothetical protein [unclassified Spirosoma]|uniref:hypothetical protein n=1 Tax=unclassified Spirosoma TaxID=2621999 RepID=UPI000966CFEC|nr:MULTISPECIES: hypothetical protein [unclassified Spirosoma]MBN8822809.1 hypothetical protein [Spirosoma sp.]OJW80010.1 MAG: hypothetical protein BGO59_02020 [Spirosoma sp. 48-14]
MNTFYTPVLGLVATLIMTQSIAQKTPKSIAGEYYLTGVREVGSGIKLNPDSTFEFFFAYGALDRMGKGTWKLQGDQIILNSRPKPDKDFALVKSRTVPGNQLTIRIVDTNKQLLSYILVGVKHGADIQQGTTNANGQVHFNKHPVDALMLQFEFCPERFSIFQVAHKEHNDFEFRFEPWLMDVFFENLSLTLSDNALKGPHPLLDPNKSYSFQRN